MDEGSLLITVLIAWAAMPIALWWAYRVTRVPAVIVYGIWFLVGHFVLPVGEKVIIAHYVRSSSSWPFAPSRGTLAVELSMLTNVVGSVLLIWLLVSLVRWGKSVVGTTRRSLGRPTVPVVEQ